MTTWSFYDPATGEFTGRTYNGPHAYLVMNTPEGLLPHEGAHDPSSRKLDTATGEVVDWVRPVPAPDPTVVASEVRATRDRLIASCDWVVTKSLEKGEPVPAAWQEYRQSLRDITEQPGFPLSVEWPVAPS